MGTGRLRICRFCGWVGERGLWDDFEDGYTACPICLSSHDALMRVGRRVARMFDWRTAFERMRRAA